MKVYECIFSLITGIGVFILAMKIMTDSLKELAGERMKSLLEKLANNRVTGVLVGALVTAVIQSSSATTVMMIGFVNADVMTLNQAAAIIIGSNIGTTATGLLASLESLNISLYLSMLVFTGVMLTFVKKIKKVANLLTGLGMIFVGLKLMSNACNDKSIKDEFEKILQKIDFPLLLEVLGMVFTAIIQSSSAMTGIVIVMVGNKVMGMDNGLFITLGANVGTCITALLGIIGANINSKRTAVIHLSFNIFGCLLFTPILWIFKSKIIGILDSIVANPSMQIAYFHLFFNTITALICLPLIDCLVKIAKSVVKDPKPDRLIVETMEEKEHFHIRKDTSTSNIYFDDTSNSRFNENSVIENISPSFFNDNIRYEPPNILENYFSEKGYKEDDMMKNGDSDNEEDIKEEEKDNVELIIVDKDKNKKKDKKQNKDIENKEDIDNIKIENNNKDEDEEEENKLLNKLRDDLSQKKQNDIEQNKNEENDGNVINNKNDDLNENINDKNIDEDKEDDKIKEKLDDKIDKPFKEEKESEKIAVNEGEDKGDN